MRSDIHKATVSIFVGLLSQLSSKHSIPLSKNQVRFFSSMCLHSDQPRTVGSRILFLRLSDLVSTSAVHINLQTVCKVFKLILSDDLFDNIDLIVTHDEASVVFLGGFDGVTNQFSNFIQRNTTIN